MQARVYRWPARFFLGGLMALSGAGLPATFVILTTSTRLLLPPARALWEAKLILVLSIVPLLIARVLQWTCGARIRNEAESLLIIGPTVRIEIPRASIARIVPWTLPLPGPGFWFVMNSGRRFRSSVEPRLMGEALAQIGLQPAQSCLDHPMAAYAAARQGVVWRWYHRVIKFALFPLLPGLLIFRLHQFITFGGTLGEYYLSGLRPYLETLTLYLTSTCMDCILWASLWRSLGEVCAWAAAWLVPSRSVAIRQAIEIACSLMYYGGITAMIVYAFLR
jgi:apolipoprotein N-acyltransferase